MTKLKNLLVLPLIAACSSLYAQKVDTFNINKATATYISAYPEMLTAHGNDLYFSANDNIYGPELWTMPKGATFPKRLTDIQAGGKVSIPGNVRSICVFDNKVYFSAQDTLSNIELWSYDIATANVHQIADINPGVQGSGVGLQTVLGDQIYFPANDGTHGQELWTYDPLRDTAYMTVDLNPGSANASILDLYVFQGRLFFGANNGVSGYEPYEYDPSTNTISLISNINPGKLGGLIGKFVTLNNQLYFTATDGATGFELYQYMGLGNPVQRLTDLYPNKGNGIQGYSNSIAYKSKIYFDGYDIASGFYQLCGYDPISKTTTMHKPSTTTTGFYVGEMVIYNDKIFFAGNDGVNGIELWSFDGVNPPVLAADVLAGPAGSSPKNLTVTDGYLYFSADVKGTIGQELFRYKDNTVGIENLTRGTSITAYPNPSQGSFTVALSYTDLKTGSIKVTDMMGRLVHQQNITKGEKQIAITLPNAAAGMYHLSVSLDEQTTTQNILIN